jgi:hypothetical protein
MSVFRVGNKSTVSRFQPNNEPTVKKSVKNIINSNLELDFPKVLPSLDLDFVNSNVLDQRVDFTRASGGSYVGPDGLIKYAGINQPRFDYDPETGECLGLLMEEARTNLINQSENFNTWTLNSDTDEPPTITRKLSDVKSPDGASNYFLCTYGRTDLRRNFSGGFGRTYTASCFFKQPFEGNFSDLAAFEMHITGGGTTVAIGRVTYRFSTNRIIRSDRFGIGVPPIRTGFKKYADGSVRLWLTMTDNGSGTSVFFLNLRGGNTIANTGKSILTWGAQIEEGNFPTSYIPTRGATRTRAADSFQIIGKNFDNWFRKDEGTIFVAHKALPQVNFNATSSTPTLIYNFTNSNNILGTFYNTNFNTSDIFVFNRQADVITDTIRFQQDQQSRNRAIFSYNIPQQSYQPYIDGNKIINITNSAPYIKTSYDRLILTRTVSGTRFNGHYQRFTYYPKSLPDSQLQSLTL